MVSADVNSLLAPIGLHRKSFITPSKGKRKRKHQHDKHEEESARPPAPEIRAHVDVGLASISRNLQEMVAAAGKGSSQAKNIMSSNLDSAEEAKTVAGPQSVKGGASGPGDNDSKGTADKVKLSLPSSPYSVIIVARSGQSSAFHCHFPQMVALASKSQPREKAIRLVGLSKPCEEKLSAALGIPRVSSIALRDDASELQVKGLVEFVRERVAPVSIAWLEEASSGQYRATNIEEVRVKIGQAKVKR